VDEVLKEVQDVVTNQRDDQEMAESEQKILQWMSDVCDLQSSHIHASKEGFSQAIDHIRQSIYTIINQIQSIVSDMQGIGGEREGFSVLEKIQKDISLVVQALRQTAGKSNEVVDIMKVVGGVIHEMGEFIGNVEEVGFQIERIGLNASVQAAHIGENGRAMGVLAEAIHSLSLESNKQTQDITKILNEVISESKRFQTQAQEANELASKESDLIVSFEGLIRVLQQTQTNIQINLDEVGKLSNNLIEKLRTITEDRQLEHELMERFENAQQELGAIRQKVSEYLPEQGVNRSERLNSLLEKYTMESERQVHMQLFGHEEDAADDNISLFDDEAADNVELFDDLGGFEDNPEEKEEENEFGDNVELF
jgi:methyl-accepting chemotaxis protein